jgi:hypothetical protein
MIAFMHGHPRNPTNWCQGSNEVTILVSWGVAYDVTSLQFWEKVIKTVVRNYRWDILTNEVSLNQTMFPNRPWIFQ